MADVRWGRNALGYVLELNPKNRDRLSSQVKRLGLFPRLGVPLLGPYQGKRRLVVGPFSVVYEYDFDSDVVSVLAITRGWPPRPL